MSTTGTNSNDTLIGTNANDIINGGNGDDTIFGGGGADNLSGDNGNDIIDGGAGNDNLSGGNGNDVLDGGSGSDLLFGNNGNDTAVYVAVDNLTAHDVYEGGNGTDTLVLKLTQTQLNEMNASTVFADFHAAVGSNAAFDFSAYGFSFNINLTAKGFEQIQTVLIADPAPPIAHADVNAITEDGTSSTVAGNVLANDSLGGIADTTLSVINAGALAGHYGTLTLNADGNYSYLLDQTNPAVDGLNEGDTLQESFAYTITDGYGHAISQLTITINGHTDLLPLFTAGNDVVDFNAIVAGSYRAGTQYDALGGNDSVILPGNAAEAAEAGFVVGTAFHTGDGQNTVFGGGLDDIVIGGNGSDTIDGGAGNDMLSGGGGNDVLTGGLGDDLIDGGDGTDAYVLTTAGFVSLANGIAASTTGGIDHLISIEQVYGSAFNDLIVGNDSDNTLAGGDGDDRIEAGGGNDIVISGAGHDILDGGGGINRIDYSRLDIGVTVQLDAGGGYTQKTYFPADITSDSLMNFRDVTGTNFDDRITGDAQDNSIFGGGGNDFIRGGTGNDRLDGGIGSDLLFGEDGDDELFSDSFHNRMDGGAGNDTANYSGVLTGLEINLFGGVAGVPPIGNSYPSPDLAPDTLISIENIVGSQGNNSITGNDSDNRITGFLGNDTMTGAGGHDVFYFDLSGGANVGNDIIVDFEIGTDRISLGGGLHANLTDLNPQQIGEDTVLDLGPGMRLTLQHVIASQLTNSDFVFA